MKVAALCAEAASMRGRGDAVEKSTREIMAESNRIGVQFLLADLTAALTFLDVSETTQLQTTQHRNRANARLAYETVVRLLPRVSPSKEEDTALKGKLAELRDRLKALGYELVSERGGA